MPSRRAQILDAVFAALGASTATDLATGATYTKPAGLSVYRTRAAALAAGDLPAICILRVEEENTRGAGGHKDRRRFLFGVEAMADAATDGKTAEDALDPLTSWATQAISNIAALQGGTGALAHSTVEAVTKWDDSDTDAVYVRARVGFHSDYITAAGNPDAA
jgi:hypothetical protein